MLLLFFWLSISLPGRAKKNPNSNVCTYKCAIFIAKTSVTLQTAHCVEAVAALRMAVVRLLYYGNK